MDVYYLVEFVTESDQLNSFSEDPADNFTLLVKDIRTFCRLFRFSVFEQNSCWGEESESSPYLREAYLSFVIYKKVGTGELGIIMPAMQAFAHFKKLTITNEFVSTTKKFR